jgi:hypothetical protein
MSETAIEDEEETGENSEESAGGGFPKITKRFEEKGHTIFEDPAYYKTIMGDGSDQAKRLHATFQKYSTTKDPKDKAVFRQQLTTAFWDFLSAVARGAPAGLSGPKKYLLRFALLHPNLLNAETKTMFSKAVETNELQQPVYYLDEWFGMIGRGELRPSTTDEGPVKSNTSAHLIGLLEKAKGKLEGSIGILRSKNTERQGIETSLTNLTAELCKHDGPASFEEVAACYSESQKRSCGAIQNLLRDLLKTDRDMELLLRDYDDAAEDLETVKRKIEESGGEESAIDTSSVDTEFGTVRQLAKMTIGRQGNSFPLLTGEFFHNLANTVGVRENVLSIMAWIESVDLEAFTRVYKNKPTRVVPYVILIPTYGDTGACWESIDRSNKATGRGRIAVPMYPKNLPVAVLTAVADFRWQAAKEKAAYYWMEEGLTGNYYQWFQAQKLKGDVRMYFIQDYILWMTKESEGTQKLDKEVRSAFWRYMPFTQPVKEKLKDRNLIYQELYQRDLNRAKSDI